MRVFAVCSSINFMVLGVSSQLWVVEITLPFASLNVVTVVVVPFASTVTAVVVEPPPGVGV